MLLPLQIGNVAERTEGMSGADLKALAQEAAMEPMRAHMNQCKSVEEVAPSDIAPLCLAHFETALGLVRPSVASGNLDAHIRWNGQYGSLGSGLP